MEPFAPIRRDTLALAQNTRKLEVLPLDQALTEGALGQMSRSREGVACEGGLKMAFAYDPQPPSGKALIAALLSSTFKCTMNVCERITREII